MFPNTLEDRKKMLSVLITDQSRIFKDTYEIPQNISYHDLRIEKIVLANTWDNVTGNVWVLNADNSDKTIAIPDGRYNEDDYSEYLQQYLTANTSNVIWDVGYNKNTNKFDIYANNSSSAPVTLKPNEAAQKITGFGAVTTYDVGDRKRIFAAERAQFTPSYLTIKSSALKYNSYAYKGQTSDIICFLPLQTDASNSVWQETVSFPDISKTIKTINNQIDLQFHLNNDVKIEDPIFSLEISFI
jgi:hypothetical protein